MLNQLHKAGVADLLCCLKGAHKPLSEIVSSDLCMHGKLRVTERSGVGGCPEPGV
jgi:hypothetical protein